MKHVITAAFPFIPAELSLAHFASTYLPADIFYKFMKLQDYDCIFLSATDVHGTWIKKKLLAAESDYSALVSHWDNIYRSNFQSMRIDFSHYHITSDKILEKLVHDSLWSLRNNNHIYQDETTVFQCEMCFELLPKRFRNIGGRTTKTGKIELDFNDKQTQCSFCGSNDIAEKISQHWFLDLSKHEETIRKVISNFKSPAVKNYLLSTVNKGLQPWNFTRDNYLGIKVPFSEDKFVYLWFDSLLGYLIEIEKSNLLHNIDEMTFYHFCGKNIVYYHGIIWPVLLSKGVGKLPKNIQISARGFLDINNSSKELVALDEACKMFDPDYIRFYLALRTPDNTSDFSFDINEFTHIINDVVCNQIGSFFSRCHAIFVKNGINNTGQVPANNPAWDKWWPEIKLALTQTEIRKSLLLILKYFKDCGKFISVNKLYINLKKEDIGVISNMFAAGLLLIYPFMPRIAKELNVFDNFEFNSINNLLHLSNTSINHTIRRINKIV